MAANSNFAATPALIACGDVNDDGIQDFAHRVTAASWRVRSGADGSAVTTLGGPVTAQYGESSALGLGDVNADGNADLLIFDGTNLSLYSGFDNQMLWSQAAGSAGGTGFYGLPLSLVRLGDVDGDGKDDFATGPGSHMFFGLGGPLLPPNGGGFGIPLVAPNPVDPEIRSGATGLVIQTLTAPVGATTESICAGGDADGDGDGDLLVLRVNGSGQHTLDIHDATTGSIVNSITPQFPGATFSWGLQIAGGVDFDGDGADDVAFTFPMSQVGGPNSGSISLQSCVDGSQIAAINGTPCAGIGVFPVVGDFNGDARGDVACSQFDDTGAPNIGRVFSGVSGELLGSSFGNLTNCDAVALVDVNGDGYDDLIAAGTAFNASTALHTFSFTAIAGGPMLGDAADGNAGGNPDLLCVNGSAGDNRRCVEIPRGAPINFELLQPMMNPQPADFAIFGCIGVPREDETFDGGPGVGDFAMIPAPALTWAIPAVFTLATNINGVPGTVFQTGPAPWSLDLPLGIDAEITFTLQAVVRETATEIRKTNGLIVRIR
jgi:hypothetical protein